MVSDITLLQWINLAAACILFLGPGLALAAFLPSHRQLPRTALVLLAFALSLSAWVVLLAWLQPTGIRLTRYSSGAIFLLGWAAAFWRWWPVWKQPTYWKPAINLTSLAMWGVALIAFGTGLYNVRTLVAGLGSDAYHHTLIANLIMTQGRLPDDFLPLIPLSTFSYHYGYHALLAALDWWSAGIPGRLMAVILFPGLVGISALAAGSLSRALTHSRIAGLTAASLTGLVTIFPAFMGNWGRYTQITGTVMMMLFLLVVWEWRAAGFTKGWLPWVALLAAGTGLTHYRMALMSVCGVLALLLVGVLYGEIKLKRWHTLLIAWNGALGLALLLALPWFMHNLNQQHTGYTIQLAAPADIAFTLARLGTAETDYATTPVVLGLALAAVVLGLLKRSQIVIWIMLWGGLLWVFSQPFLLGRNMDFVSAVISSYVLVSILAGWLVDAALNNRIGNLRWVRWAAALTLVCLSLWGILTIKRNVSLSAATVRPNDLAAAEWISVNTPPEALFAVNTHHWDWRPDYVIGADAGYWLPLLAGRRTVTVPMIYDIERASQPDLNTTLVALDQLEGHLTTPQALVELNRQGVTHVFTGERGQRIKVDELLASPHYQLLFQQGNSYVFKLIP